MPDIDSPLDTRLQSFFAEIKGQGLPSQITSFNPATAHAGRRMLNLFAGAAGIAVVAASVAAFAVELNGHHSGGSLIPGGQSSSSPMPQPTPSFRPSIPVQAHGAKVLIPVTYGSGPTTFPTVTMTRGDAVVIEYGCISNHSTATATPTAVSHTGPVPPGWLPMQVGPCVNSNGGAQMVMVAGGPLTLHLGADPTVNWVVLVFELPPPALSVFPLLEPTATPTPTSTAPSTPAPTPPTLADSPAPAGATVLVPVTYGTGPMTLPTFTETATDQIYIEVGCLSTSPSVTTLTVNEYDPAFAGDAIAGSCFGARGGGVGSGYVSSGGMVTMKIQAAPTEKWVILVYEGPFGEFGP